MHTLLNSIQIETTTACPAKCPMCPRDTQKRPHGTMDTDLFYSIVDQAVALDVPVMLPFINGEPLADKRMVEFVEAASEIWPALEIGWYTNAALLTPDVAKRLIAAGNIKHFNISMQGGTKDVYECNMGLSWERTVANVKSLIEINKAAGSPMEVRLNMCVFSKTSATVDAFRALWEPLGCTICLGCYSNVGGMVSDSEGEDRWKTVPRNPCRRALWHMYVYWNGDVGQCCFDLIGTATYGNLHTTRLRDILHSDAFQRMRATHTAIDVPNMPVICQNCNASKFHG